MQRNPRHAWLLLALALAACRASEPQTERPPGQEQPAPAQQPAQQAAQQPAQQPAPARPAFADIDASLAPLRARFQDDDGLVRVIMLVAPT